jgi:hypothetical protein
VDSIAAATANMQSVTNTVRREAHGTSVGRIFMIVRREVFEGPWAIPQFVEYATRNNK